MSSNSPNQSILLSTGTTTASPPAALPFPQILPNLHQSPRNSLAKRRILFSASSSNSPASTNRHHHQNHNFHNDDDDDEYNQQNNKNNLFPAATLQERILQAKVAELSNQLQKVTIERDGLSKSLRSAVIQNDSTKAKLDSVTDLLAVTVEENKKYHKLFEEQKRWITSQQNIIGGEHNNHNHNLAADPTFITGLKHQHESFKRETGILKSGSFEPFSKEISTQCPEVPDSSAFEAEIERQTLYSSKDVRAALISLLDRHEDVKDLLLRNSWLQRNADHCEQFPSFVKPIRPVAIEMVNGRRPPTAETLMNANDTPRSILHSELSELTRRANPVTRHKTLSQSEKFREKEREKRTGILYHPNAIQNNNNNGEQGRNSPGRNSPNNSKRNLAHFSPPPFASRPGTAATITSSSPGTRPASRR
jgi:hypothetical protein